MKEIIYKQIFDFLTQENEKYNLTAIKDYNDFLLKHIKDSELGKEFVYGKVLDIGSGAGFPGIVLKIKKPEINITMIDGTGKKVNFINSLIKKLNLKDARAIHTRIEDYNEKEKFDVVTARAVAPLKILAEYALPFLKIGGVFVAYKSEDVDNEIKEADNAIKKLGGKLIDVKERKLNEEITRKFIIIKKEKKCDSIYPRKQNKPRLQPL